ncbi:unnamed protein product [Linum tenue]|uniref:Uncharacterized protein n=1 Tax=Linum tenue TaxID=586396 RepID=A0AAV0J8R9_9ROSI|nr:unnamed protein product [Linum tenue]
MERVLKPYDKEYMRLAMLKHEETFKEQVYELHRLYRIQKLMMRSIGKTNKNTNNNQHQIPSNKHQELWNNGFSFNSRSNNVSNIVVAAPPSNHHHHHDKLAVKLDLERRPAAEEFAESNGDHVEEERNGTVVMEECEIELTLGPASYCSRRKKLCQEETALTSESGGGSLSSSSTGSSRINRRSNKLGSSRVDDPENGMMKKQKQNSNVDNNEQLTRQQQQDSRLKQQQQPPWLYQVLSLKMT